ncbi:MAG: hypothetical protein E6833_09320 [Bradyrhizobium sp.]|jgi:hypothetical protein|nr:hypothetical protein [Bradyrhizobium sp.]
MAIETVGTVVNTYSNSSTETWNVRGETPQAALAGAVAGRSYVLGP